MARIYDFFMFGGYDEDILDIRLNTLKDIVYKFIITESEYSHSGIFKGLRWPEIKEKYKDIEDKIIYYPIKKNLFEALSSKQDPWIFEQNSRQYSYEKFKHNLGDEDVLLVCDLDEIPNVGVLEKECKVLTQPITLCGDYYMFCLDLFGRKSIDGFLTKPEWVNQTSLNWMRSHRTNFQYNYFKHIPDSSFHYSTVATPQKILNKMCYFGHANECPKDVLSLDWIKQCIVEKRGSISKESKKDELKLIILTKDNCPEYLFQNQEKFKHLFYQNYL
jgi:beta-1,4-mannosyl-glycoprotein beta-1,4-N-acetylglucosaminyltransferase